MMDLGLTGEGGKRNRMHDHWVCTIAPVKEAVACMMNLCLLTAVICTRGRSPVAWACTRIHLGSKGEGGRTSRIRGLCWVYMTSPELPGAVACTRDQRPLPSNQDHHTNRYPRHKSSRTSPTTQHTTHTGLAHLTKMHSSINPPSPDPLLLPLLSDRKSVV